MPSYRELKMLSRPSKIYVGGQMIARAVEGKTLIQCECLDCRHNSFSLNARPYCRLRKIRMLDNGACREKTIWGR